ncbi:hypothetical protein G5V59_14670 [Nocardioides sp. W3-2-3]|uniref:hypothetical protein n=1 Tax=Nocardioides convexus TaxID=2712224 RepID=UPI00241856FF|nr:hypothetical protein [Nocardioides convexus]NHA00780.1 hypothetical protein [Nocardioides convexus]
MLIDATTQDGTLMLVTGTGDTLVWAKVTPSLRRAVGVLPQGPWEPADEDTRRSGIRLSVAGNGVATKVVVTDVSGLATTFGVPSPPAGVLSEYRFTPESVQDPVKVGDTGKITFLHDSSGRVQEIVSPVPTGVTCDTSAVMVNGCHALTLTYGTSGNSKDRLTNIDVVHGATVKHVTSYQYDSQGRLVGVTNNRTGLTTTYAWAGTEGSAARRLASYTPPGLKPIRLEYDSEGRLSAIARDNPTGAGTTTLEQVRYDVPIQGAGASDAGLPVLDQVAVAAWNQQSAPTYAAAVFSQGAPKVAADPADVAGGDWKEAVISYTDADGRGVNTAQFGSGRWLLTAADYDNGGNLLRTLSSGDVAAVQDGEVAASDAGTLNVYGEVKNSAGTVTIAEGTVRTETFGPARAAVTTDAGGLDGQTKWVRPHSVTTYDEGAPNDGINAVTGAAYALPTRVITRPWDPATGADVLGAGTVLADTRTGYDALLSGDKSGWELGLATSTTTVMGANQPDIVNRTRYDDDGRVIETRQPSSDGSDAGTKKTTYYTSGANAADGACGNKAQWAGLVCVTSYAGGTLPAERVVGYDDDLQPLGVNQTVAGVLRRTSTTRYDSSGRVSRSWVKTEGVQRLSAGDRQTNGVRRQHGADQRGETGRQQR